MFKHIEALDNVLGAQRNVAESRLDSRVLLQCKDAASVPSAHEVPRTLENIYFPTTRFYGSKRKQLDWLFKNIHVLPGQRVLDGFGGTGTVSLLFQHLGRDVTFNDVFKFNAICARAVSSKVASNYSSIDMSKFLEGVTPTKGFISKTFSGIFFKDFENEWLDGLMLRINSGDFDTEVRDALLYCLFQACLKKRPYNLFHRANLNLRFSDMKVSFGNRTTWEKSFVAHMLEAYGELAKVKINTCSTLHVLNNGSVSNIQEKFDIVYFDPPYFHQHRTTEPYLQRYHFLEGLARYNEWPDLIDYASPIRSFKSESFPDEWSTKEDFFENLKQLIEKHKASTVVLSYVANSYPTEYAITKFFKSLFNDVSKSKRTYSRALSDRARSEILFIGRP